MAERWDQQGLDELNAWLTTTVPVATVAKNAGSAFDAVNTPVLAGQPTPAQQRFPGLDTLTMETIQLALGLKVLDVKL